jgi:hypothetical protein
MKIRSSEGDVLHQAKLHAYLAYLAADVEVAYARPTAAQHSVFQDLDSQAKSAEQKLESLTADAEKVAK